jgi:hypothetical protein
MLFHIDLAFGSSPEKLKCLSSCFILTARAASCMVIWIDNGFSSPSPSSSSVSEGSGFYPARK